MSPCANHVVFFFLEVKLRPILGAPQLALAVTLAPQSLVQRCLYFLHPSLLFGFVNFTPPRVFHFVLDGRDSGLTLVPRQFYKSAHRLPEHRSLVLACSHHSTSCPPPFLRTLLPQTFCPVVALSVSLSRKSLSPTLLFSGTQRASKCYLVVPFRL